MHNYVKSRITFHFIYVDPLKSFFLHVIKTKISHNMKCYGTN